MSTIQAGLFDHAPRTVPDRIGPAAVRAVETMHLLTPGKGRTATYDYTLNPYRGCSFGCSYCYAAFFVADEKMREEWGQWVEAKVNAADALRRKDLQGRRIFMSSVTDPYQPLEQKLELTREVVEILAEQGARLVVQTRSPLAARDIDLFLRFKHVRVNMSVTTDDDSIRKQFEPGCASIERRLDAVQQIAKAGIKANVCLCPMLPMDDPEAFGRRLVKMGVNAVAASWFHTGDRAFAAGTRDPAIALAEKLGWTRKEYEQTRAALATNCPLFGESTRAFGPV